MKKKICKLLCAIGKKKDSEMYCYERIIEINDRKNKVVIKISKKIEKKKLAN